MGITYGDHLIDSGYYDITPEQEREIEAREECARRGIDPDELCADGGVEAWMVVHKEIAAPPAMVDINRASASIAIMVADWYGNAPLPAARITAEVIAQRLARFVIAPLSEKPIQTSDTKGLSTVLREWAGTYEEGSFDTEAGLMGEAAAALDKAERTIAARNRRIARLVEALDYARAQGVRFPADDEPPVVLSAADHRTSISVRCTGTTAPTDTNSEQNDA
jgi:hypothetical protein